MYAVKKLGRKISDFRKLWSASSPSNPSSTNIYNSLSLILLPSYCHISVLFRLFFIASFISNYLVMVQFSEETKVRNSDRFSLPND